MLEDRGFTAQDFRVFHPGGKLGASLRHVNEIMHVGDKLPLVQTGATMAEVIRVITEKGFGCVGVLDGAGVLIGIITDGDIRRHIADGFLDHPVDGYMTRNPRVARPDTLLASAIETLNSIGILALVVVDDGKPVGLVHMHDLLRAGVA